MLTEKIWPYGTQWTNKMRKSNIIREAIHVKRNWWRYCQSRFNVIGLKRSGHFGLDCVVAIWRRNSNERYSNLSRNSIPTAKGPIRFYSILAEVASQINRLHLGVLTGSSVSVLTAYQSAIALYSSQEARNAWLFYGAGKRICYQIKYSVLFYRTELIKRRHKPPRGVVHICENYVPDWDRLESSSRYFKKYVVGEKWWNIASIELASPAAYIGGYLKSFAPLV